MALFNVSEIVDMAIEKEKRRRDFYDLVSKNFSAQNIKELFVKLRDWEETHIKKISRIRQSLNQEETTDSYPGELQEYIANVIDNKLYNDVTPLKFKDNVNTPLDAIRYGISFEKDAIIFFNEFLPYISTREDNQAIKDLIEEEKQHIIYLVKLRESLKNN